MVEATGKSGRGRCEEHDLARGPDGRCVLCRRDETPPAPRRKVHRAVVLVGVLTTLFGGAAFARGVVASRAARAAPLSPAVLESHEATAPRPPPPVETTHQNPEPVATPAPSTTTNHRLDDALATVTPERPLVKPEPKVEIAETPTPSDAPCVCRPRVAHLGVNRPYNAWGPDHDSEGHLAVKSRLHAAWGPPPSFDETPKCACPRGTVRVRPHVPAQGGSTTDHISPG